MGTKVKVIRNARLVPFAIAPLLVLAAACGSSASDDKASSAALKIDAPAAGSIGCSQLMDSSLAKAAKKEGKVSLTNSATPVFSENVLPVFEKESGIKVDLVSGRSSELVPKLQSERNAKIYSYDVFLGGASTLASVFYPNKWITPFKSALITKEALDPKAYVLGELPFKDPEGEYVFANSSYATGQLAYNTDKVDPADISTWESLLDPKWKGKIVIDDPTGGGSGGHVASGLRDKFGDEFFLKLYKDQKPAILADYEQELNGVASGQYLVGIAPRSELIRAMKKKGLPIDITTPTDARMSSNGASNLAIYSHAPHPNAAALFANWLACPEGNELFNGSYDYVSVRNDVKSDAPSYMKIDPSVTYFDTGSWKQSADSDKIDEDNAKLLGKS